MRSGTSDEIEEDIRGAILVLLNHCLDGYLVTGEEAARCCVCIPCHPAKEPVVCVVPVRQFQLDKHTPLEGVQSERGASTQELGSHANPL